MTLYRSISRTLFVTALCWAVAGCDTGGPSADTPPDTPIDWGIDQPDEPLPVLPGKQDIEGEEPTPTEDLPVISVDAPPPGSTKTASNASPEKSRRIEKANNKKKTIGTPEKISVDIVVVPVDFPLPIDEDCCPEDCPSGEPPVTAPPEPYCETNQDCVDWIRAQIPGEPVPEWFGTQCNEATNTCDYYVCGDDHCHEEQGENADNCAADCAKTEPTEPGPDLPPPPIGPPPTLESCGDDVCADDENAINCLADCDGEPGVVCKAEQMSASYTAYSYFDCEGQCQETEYSSWSTGCRPAYNCEAYDYDDGNCEPCSADTDCVARVERQGFDAQCTVGKCNPVTDTCEYALGQDLTPCGVDGVCIDLVCYDTCGDGVCDGYTLEDVWCADDCASNVPVAEDTVENCDGGTTATSKVGDGTCDSELACAATAWDGGDCEPTECVPPADNEAIEIDGSCSFDGTACGAGDQGTCFDSVCYDMTCGNRVCDNLVGEDGDTCAADCCVSEPAACGADESACTGPNGAGICYYGDCYTFDCTNAAHDAYCTGPNGPGMCVAGDCLTFD